MTLGKNQNVNSCFVYYKIYSLIFNENNFKKLCRLQNGNFQIFILSNHKAENLIQLKSSCSLWAFVWCLLLNWLVVTVIFSVSFKLTFDLAFFVVLVIFCFCFHHACCKGSWLTSINLSPFLVGVLGELYCEEDS